MWSTAQAQHSTAQYGRLRLMRERESLCEHGTVTRRVEKVALQYTIYSRVPKIRCRGYACG